MKQRSRAADFRGLLKRLLRYYGPQQWWPADTPFEVCIGAVLTQNTAWTNVERAIANLKKARVCNPRGLAQMRHHRLAQLLRPSGYFNIKAKRLRSFVRFFKTCFGFSIQRMNRMPLHVLRHQLLQVHGIGRETADSILLYALNKPIFVVDAYTRRIFSRHGWISGNEDYDVIRAKVEMGWERLPDPLKVREFNELHALLVAIGKEFCRPSHPRCNDCPLRSMLPRKALF